MSEKRPETNADIVSRSKVVWGRGLDRVPRNGRPRYSVDLPAHMAECDANYHRILQILPDLKSSDLSEGVYQSLQLAELDGVVTFEVLEKGPYTTLLKISLTSQVQVTEMSALQLLEMTVRVYHDARSAEVVSYQNQNRFHGKYDYPNRGMRQRDEKVQLNRLLSEFLTLCLSHGASTAPVSF